MAGYGRMMAKEGLKKLSDAGVKEVWLTTNPNVKAFWCKMGFIGTGEISKDNGYEIMKLK